ncbi:PAS domain S-box protein [Solirubrobacter soli]|uniref:PAS domain S-box protein n=1 Tax=Solirubrobacter soli TaxID=363832 RepID=UPI000415DE14|nr:PAS domain S-box protein [Solirubrobacter soli]
MTEPLEEIVERFRRSERRAQLLADVSLTLNASVDDLDRALELAAQQISDAIGDTCSIYLLSDDGQWLDCVAQAIRDPVQRSLGERVGIRHQRFHIEGNQLGDVIRRDATHFSPTMPGDVRDIVGPEHDDLVVLRAFSNIMAPLRARARVIGLVSITRTVPGAAAYTEEDREFLEQLAPRVAVAIDAAQLYRTAQDAIAARTLSEQRLRAMFNSTRVGIVARDGDGRVVECNRAYAAMLGYQPDELIGSDYAELSDPAEFEAHRRRYRESFAAGDQDLEFEHTYVRRDGSMLHARVTASLVRDIEGRPLYSLALVEDVSERHRLEQQLVQSQKMEAVGRLAGGIAHDFNNVLTAILGFSDVVATTIGAEHPAQTATAEIRVAAERANALTRQLLTFSRHQVLEREAIEPNEVIEGLAPMLHRLLGDDVSLELALEPTAGTVVANRGQLEQVIVNLAVNARDAMPGGGRLTIATASIDADSARARLDLEPGPLVVIAVTDTGHGMDAATQQRIFEPFFTTKPIGAGSGLGLAVAYGIVTQNDGALSVYSEPGHGSTFRIHLPRSAPTGAAAPPDRDAAVRQADEGGSETILIAEDDRAIRTLIQLVLEEDGYTVLSAATPADALELAQRHPVAIDLIVTDMIMPGMSGPELAERIREHRPAIGVLFTSGYSNAELVRRGLPHDVPFIEKPFTPEGLKRTIRGVLRAAPTRRQEPGLPT